jgi:hypothetical protein
MPINRIENPCTLPGQFKSQTDQLLYEAIIAAGGFLTNFAMIQPQPENKGFQQPPYSANTNALLYELVMTLQAGGGGGGGLPEVFVDDDL